MAMRSKNPELSVDEVRARFEEWRKNRQGRGSIPEELWLAAVGVARKDGITRTAAALHLDGGKLKRLMGGKATSGKPAPTFVELLAPPIASPPECTIDLEGRRGKIRIQLKGTSVSDLATLSRALWEAAS
jgi:hypothetical protein